MLEPRARAAGKSFSARFEYNSRHQVTKVTYPKADNSTAGDPCVTYEHDRYGNCTKITNELGHTLTFTFDEYRRCTSYTESVNAPNCTGSGTVASRTHRCRRARR